MIKELPPVIPPTPPPTAPVTVAGSVHITDDTILLPQGALPVSDLASSPAPPALGVDPIEIMEEEWEEATLDEAKSFMELEHTSNTAFIDV